MEWVSSKRFVSDLFVPFLGLYGSSLDPCGRSHNLCLLPHSSHSFLHRFSHLGFFEKGMEAEAEREMSGFGPFLSPFPFPSFLSHLPVSVFVKGWMGEKKRGKAGRAGFLLRAEGGHMMELLP